MEARIKYSIIMLTLGLILAFLPLSGNRSLSVKPAKLMAAVINDTSYFTVDQVARFVVNEDSTIRLIDLRTPLEFSKNSIPGAVNMPYIHFLDTDPQNYFSNRNIKNIFYSSDDLDANYAWVIVRGFGYENVYVMKGGLREWYNTVMNSNFTGDRITARQNAVFEIRFRARRLFTEINNLPDSLKKKSLLLKRIEKKKLDGGC